jgi:SpoVK/Ycf46/Vps4 family AAA+-type ATPase
MVEEKLKKIFAVAEKWNAVLLLDECDVFLEERSAKDLARNSYVAIFLRNLEYYKGILFMTTNRPSCIDSAFQSRIHFTIRYPVLDSAARKQIWMQLVERSGHDSALTAGDFKRLSQMDMNGRDIKNTLKTAQLLAITDGKALDMRHLQTVLRVRYGNGLGDTGALWIHFSYLLQLLVSLLSLIAEFLHLPV